MPPPFEISPPDMGPWLAGNTGTPGVWRWTASEPGRRVMVSALVHGNELCGAWAVRDLLASGLRPRRGTLTVALANLDAFARFNPQRPHVSRCVHTDMNRLWGDMPWRHDGTELASEHRRVLELQPHVEASDWLLDLHSMHEPGPPLALTGPLAHHASRAAALGLGALRVADPGHKAGVRLRDHGRFGRADAPDAFALLVECGYHGARASVTVARDALARFLDLSGVVDAQDMPAGWRQPHAHGSGPLLEVTDAVTVAPHSVPAFTKPWKSGDRIAKAGTLIGWNAALPVITPYDDCVLVMPTLLHARPGATLVRFARTTP
ncbi:MAG: succinylglutamate desuccinylase [Comamonadaceae bacterium]|jgi:predicted deacylase|uniref:Succinylglutamate desuccinylase n=2 Tax=Comamonadaceae TaxID=80864 RepID=A0A372ELC0_9BURK|nr:succinylglutamate desuccinylase [Comamonadaceae bacterium]RFP80177.1 succinylglutamate desuccinylase [Hydrogenophaga borbori]